MGDYYSESIDEMHAFYGNSNPTKEEQFRFEGKRITTVYDEIKGIWID